MPKVKLDHAFCLTAQCQPGKRKTDWWCTHTTGLILECRSTGGKTLYFRFTDQHQRQRQIKLGAVGDISFEQARKKAQKLRSEVVLGGDPAADRADQKAIPTYASLAAQHLAHAAMHQKRPENTEMVMRRHILPRWGKLHLTVIRSQDVAAWLSEKAAEGYAPATVEKMRVVFGRSFELGKRWGIPGAENNPVRGLERPKFDNRRSRYLSTEEAARLFKVLDHSLNPQLKHVVALLLLTGARVSELLHAEWRHVNVERRAWLIPLSKTGKSRHVPLSQAAVDVIEQLPRFDGCSYLLPNPETRLPFVSIKHSWQTARKAAGLGDLHIHDLRHSAASFMINAGIDLYAWGRCWGTPITRAPCATATWPTIPCLRRWRRGRRTCVSERQLLVDKLTSPPGIVMVLGVAFPPLFSFACATRTRNLCATRPVSIATGGE
jgi:integrase